MDDDFNGYCSDINVTEMHAYDQIKCIFLSLDLVENCTSSFQIVQHIEMFNKSQPGKNWLSGVDADAATSSHCNGAGQRSTRKSNGYTLYMKL